MALNIKRNQYKELLNKVANSEKGYRRIVTIQTRNFEAAKTKFLEDFLYHPVTRELQDGYKNPSADLDYSNILGYGNLYSFMGIDHSKGDTVEKVYDALEKSMQLIFTERKIVGNSGNTQLHVRFSVRLPRGKLKEITTLPWDTGTSWLFNLEDGISGFSHYIRGRFSQPPSYSTGGLQVKATLSGPDEVETPYFKKILNNFIDYFKKLRQR